MPQNYWRSKVVHWIFFSYRIYQDSLSGYGGTKHSSYPSPKKIIIDKDNNGKLTYHVFAEEQRMPKNMLNVLGYYFIPIPYFLLMF